MTNILGFIKKWLWLRFFMAAGKLETHPFTQSGRFDCFEYYINSSFCLLFRKLHVCLTKLSNYFVLYPFVTVVLVMLLCLFRLMGTENLIINVQ